MSETNPVARRRTFAIISHPDAGKTTLTEKILLFGGAIQLAGEVRAKANRRKTRSDWMGIERERGISVVTSVMTFEYGGCVFNLLDTPGHEDFSEDTYRTLTAVNSAVMVIDAAKGIEARTRKLFEVCRLTRHSDRHLHQQDGPRDARPVRPSGRDREDAGARYRAAQLDDRPRPIARRRLRHPPQDADAAGQGRRGDRRRRPRRSAGRRAPARARARRGDRRTRSRRRRPQELRQAVLPRGPSDAGSVRQRAQGLRRQGSDRRDGRIRALAPGAGGGEPHGEGGRSQDDRLRLQDPGEHGPQPPRPHRLHARLLRQARRAACGRSWCAPASR